MARNGDAPKKNEVILKVSVQAGARKEFVEMKNKDVWSVAVREKAERNEANERVRALVARHFGVTDGAVRIRAGHRSKNKKISVIL